MALLDQIGATERLRDPIYGFIRLTEDELKIIDTPIFQRLRRIHQLALTKYVYPSAEHSRFVHSIGVMHAATLIFLELRKNDKRLALSEADLRQLRFAALLHDIGHVPFSHAAEKSLLTGGKHERLSAYIIEHTPEIAAIIDKNRLEPKSVSGLITGDRKDKGEVLSRIISGEFDADRADYLQRDCHACGVQYGIYDFMRYISSFCFENNELLIHEDNIPIVESFITARYYYNQQVVYHRTRLGYNIALGEYIKEKLKNNDLQKIDLGKDIDLEALQWFDDYTIIEMAKKDASDPNSWASYVLRLRHLKCFEQVSIKVAKQDEDGNSLPVTKIDPEQIEYRKSLEKALDEADIRWYCEDVKSNYHKLSSTTDERDDNDYLVKSRYGGALRKLMDCSPLLRGLQENERQTRRYYCKAEDGDRVTNMRSSVRGEKL